jgi:hypothetical protein
MEEKIAIEMKRVDDMDKLNKEYIEQYEKTGKNGKSQE